MPQDALVKRLANLKQDRVSALLAVVTRIAAGEPHALPNGAEEGIHGPVWQALAALAREIREGREFKEMFLAAPIKTIVFDPRDLRITYLNENSTQAMRSLEHIMSVPVAQIMGRAIDEVFAPLKEHRGRILDPQNLPYEAVTKTGEDRLEFIFTAVLDRTRRHCATMATWSVLNERVNRIRANAAQMDKVSHVAGEVDIIATSMKTAVERAATRSDAVAASAEEVSVNVKTVANAAEELAKSIEEISRKVRQSTDIASRAVTQAESTNDTIKGMAEATSKIGQILSLISDVASQTNLLALNATIEAARAGDAGKGFAVVASEVKTLANQTAKATEEIAAHVAAIQGITTQAVEAIGDIRDIIGEMSTISTSINGAVEQQTATTHEIALSVHDAAAGTAEMTNNITSVAKAFGEARTAALQMGKAADQLAPSVAVLLEHMHSYRQKFLF